MKKICYSILIFFPLYQFIRMPMMKVSIYSERGKKINGAPLGNCKKAASFYEAAVSRENSQGQVLSFRSGRLCQGYTEQTVAAFKENVKK